MPEVPPFQVQDLAFVLVVHEAPVGPFLLPPLAGSPALHHINGSLQFGVITKHLNSTLDYVLQDTVEDVKLGIPLKDPLLTGIQVECYPLATTL